MTTLGSQEDLNDVALTLSNVSRNLAMVQQLLLLCGLRSEAMMTVDIRERLIDLQQHLQTASVSTDNHATRKEDA